MGQARYYSTDPRRASVSGYAGASDPLVRPDYTGAAPDKPGASTATALDAAVAPSCRGIWGEPRAASDNQ